ncbi:p26b [Alphabaculovirus alterspexiguae]|uniref:p26b n=1 Tax=Spodoptera exigua multiple nucleopolyhedrovirus TaxID=10454 RepID=A0A3G2JU43_9ABAC|nr:p26b [Spodoptera exigua multiple nucleopolyhedrovirus]AYN45077.1 p26b [Spodoptera exigua multiple nucleopolyhedrovirus]
MYLKTLSVVLLYLSTKLTMAANVKYEIDHDKRIIQIKSVNDQAVSVTVIPPNSNNDDDNLSMLHHFPGVATSVTFPPISPDDALYVQLNNGVLYRVYADRVYTNFHTHKKRLIYGQLLTFAVDDFSISSKIYVGAPIYRDNVLVSVITCRYDDYDADLVMFPVTGIRAHGLVSGQINYDSDNIIVEKLKPEMSVYGRRQLPYKSAHMSVKHFALSTHMNREIYRNLPRLVSIFYNEKEVSIGAVEGEFEMFRVRLDGPLITDQEKEQEE